MQSIPLSSSNLKSTSYDELTSELYITFVSGGTYKYHNVPKEVYDELVDSSSPGSYFYSDIKGQYGYTRA